VTSHVTKAFRERLDRLPVEVQEHARRAYGFWRADPYHPSIQFKRVSERQPVYSARIGTGYRALGLCEDDQIYWFWIGSHAEYDEILKRI
jgi:hypothetical protein